MVGLILGGVKPKTTTSVFVASPLLYTAASSKNQDWFTQNKNNVSSGATCIPLPAKCCFSELAL